MTRGRLRCGAISTDLAVVEHDGADAIAGAPASRHAAIAAASAAVTDFIGDAAAEEHREPLVHDEQHGAVALLGVDAAWGLLRACGHLPVDRSHVVARAGSARISSKSRPRPRSRGRAAAGQQAVHRLLRQEAEAVHGALQPRRGRRGRRRRRGRRPCRVACRFAGFRPRVLHRDPIPPGARSTPRLRDGDALHDLVDDLVGA